NVFRALRPYGGTAAFQLARHAAVAQRIAEDAEGMPRAETERLGDWTLIRRAGPLPGSAPWTHQYGDAANSVVSKDVRVKAPLGLLWFGGPPNDKVLPRHGHGPSPQVAGGRLFIEGPDMLRAVDVYTGRLLWERDLPGVGAYYDVTRHFSGAGEVGSNYVSMPDHVYVIHGRTILELDAATGATTKEFTLQSDDAEPPAWGFVTAWDNLLIATSSPVTIEGDATKNEPAVPKGFAPLIEPNAKWRYLTGTDPSGEWTAPDFDDSQWKQGDAGFGYGDDDDRTRLDMQGKFERVYLRRSFDVQSPADETEIRLSVNYDDAFIAYLNGREVLRVGVGRGRGAEARSIDSHEARDHETFTLKDARKLLRPGRNVLAIEGHNVGLGSSDFTLDPYLLVRSGEAAPTVAETPMKTSPVSAALTPADHASASRRLVVFDRHTGELLWSREARFSFRHNGIAVAAGKVFVLDGLSPLKLQMLRRRGIKPQGDSQLVALDALTGQELWSTTEDVFGTFLNYSVEHDVLLQAGSAYRDRAADEVSKGMAAYRGSTGEVLWKDLSISYDGPCLLWNDKIITNGSTGFQLELLTGEPTGWTFGRMYGCNTVIGSEHLLTFRSGAAGFCDLAGDSGTGNIGGF
ncbi:MAG: PQQ-binding-like beta-propeller repeat protein, partial [Planctomycetaceae bacterium]